MRPISKVCGLMAILFLLGCAAAKQGESQEGVAKTITKEELRAIMGNPDVVVVDVRLIEGLKKGDLKIKGARRENPRKYKEWMDNYPRDKTIVLY